MKRKTRIVPTSENVFRDVGFRRDEAHNLLLRAELMLRVERFVRERGLTQTAAAGALGVTQPRLNQLLKGKIELFSLDSLVKMLANAGLRVEMRVRRAA